MILHQSIRKKDVPVQKLQKTKNGQFACCVAAQHPFNWSYLGSFFRCAPFSFLIRIVHQGKLPQETQQVYSGENVFSWSHCHCGAVNIHAAELELWRCWSRMVMTVGCGCGAPWWLWC